MGLAEGQRKELDVGLGSTKEKVCRGRCDGRGEGTGGHRAQGQAARAAQEGIAPQPVAPATSEDSSTTGSCFAQGALLSTGNSVLDVSLG